MSILSDAWRRARGEEDAVSRALGAPPLPDGQRWRRILPWSLCAVLVVLLAGLGVYVWRSTVVRQPVLTARTPKIDGNRLPGLAATAVPGFKQLGRAGSQARITQPDNAVTHESGAPGAVRAADGEQAEKKAQPQAAQPVVAARAAQTVPDAVRAALPPLTVTVHVWNPRPSSRFIIVGGHVYHEGDMLGPQLRLVSITESGQIVDFRGYLITLTDQ